MDPRGQPCGGDTDPRLEEAGTGNSSCSCLTELPFLYWACRLSLLYVSLLTLLLLVLGVSEKPAGREWLLLGEANAVDQCHSLAVVR